MTATPPLSSPITPGPPNAHKLINKFHPKKSQLILSFTSDGREHGTACLPLPVPQAAALNHRRGFLGLSFQAGAATGARSAAQPSAGDEARCPRSAVAKNVMSPLDFWLPQLQQDVILGILMTSQAIFGNPQRRPLTAKIPCPWVPP